MRETVVNLELTSRCNRRCIVCPQGDAAFPMVRRDMALADLDLFLGRVQEAAEERLFVREIISAGYGEAFIHGAFEDAFGRLARFKADFQRRWGRRPDVSVVTNGSAVTAARLDMAAEAVDILKFSFPTCEPAHYGRILARSEAEGPGLLALAVDGLRACMAARRDGRLRELRIHISPPVRQAHEDFPETIRFLVKLARGVGLDRLCVVTFPATSNRGGAVPARPDPADGDGDGFLNNFYRSHRRALHGQTVEGVRVAMLSELKVFYPRLRDVLAVLRDPFPCIWKAGSLSVDSSGNYRYCINDAASRETVGCLGHDSLAAAYRRVRSGGPRINCAACNQNPAHMGDDAVQRLYSWAARIRTRLAARRKEPRSLAGAEDAIARLGGQDRRSARLQGRLRTRLVQSKTNLSASTARSEGGGNSCPAGRR